MPKRWDENALLRKAQIESDLDVTFSHVFVPRYQELLASLKPRRVLEVGAGTGHLALKLHSLVEQYDAIEPSDGMRNVATEVVQAAGVRVFREPVGQFSAAEPYDLVLAHMVLQCVDTLGDFLAATRGHLGPKGVFAFSIPHPCFYNRYKQLIPEAEYKYMSPTTRTVSFHITRDTERAITGVPYHHRPLTEYFAALSASGFVVSTFDEVIPSDDAIARYGSNWPEPRYLLIQSRTSGA